MIMVDPSGDLRGLVGCHGNPWWHDASHVNGRRLLKVGSAR